MLTRNYIFLLLIFFLYPVNVQGQSSYNVTSYESVGGETKDEFILRIASDISFRSRSFDYEYCGEILGDRVNGYRLVLYTSRQRRECRFVRVDNYSDIVHTHPYYDKPVFSEHDYMYPGYLIFGRRVYYQSGRGTERRLR